MATIQRLKREFKFDKDGTTVTLPDPNKNFTVEEVLRFYSSPYPELTNAVYEEPEIKDGKTIYILKTSIGDKG